MLLIDANAILRYILSDNADMADKTKELLNTSKVNVDFVDSVLYGFAAIYGYDVFTFDKKLNTLINNTNTEQ